MEIIKTWLNTPGRRVWLHGIALAAFALIGLFWHVDASLGPIIALAVISIFDLLVSIVNSTAAWRTRLYGVLIAFQAIATVTFGITDQQWGVILVFVGALLGTVTAVGNTVPVPPVYGEDGLA